MTGLSWLLVSWGLLFDSSRDPILSEGLFSHMDWYGYKHQGLDRHLSLHTDFLSAHWSQGKWCVPCCSSLLPERVTVGLGGMCKIFYEPASEVRPRHYRHVIMVKTPDSYITHGEGTAQSMNSRRVVPWGPSLKRPSIAIRDVVRIRR